MGPVSLKESNKTALGTKSKGWASFKIFLDNELGRADPLLHHLVIIAGEIQIGHLFKTQNDFVCGLCAEYPSKLVKCFSYYKLPNLHGKQFAEVCSGLKKMLRQTFFSLSN